MKLILTVTVPEYQERDVKIADQIDHDQNALKKMGLALAATPDSAVSVQIEYPSVPRLNWNGR